MGREPDYEDVGCKYYPTCFGTDKSPRPDGKHYPECVFWPHCMEDITDSDREGHSKKDVIAINRWFFKEIGR